jgi:hypothetical protein
VSATGGGTACTRAAPCATFQAAHDATDPNGEINCFDSGIFGTVDVTKSITIDCTGSLAVIETFSLAVRVYVPGVVVRLRNLVLRGTAFGANAVDFQGAQLFVENCTIQGFGQEGVRLMPGASSSMSVVGSADQRLSAQFPAAGCRADCPASRPVPA